MVLSMCTVHFLQCLQYHRSFEFHMWSSMCSHASWYHCLQLPLQRIILSWGFSGIRQWQWMSIVSILTGRVIALRDCLMGNCSICPLLMQLRKWFLISSCLKVQAVGLIPAHKAVAKAKANKPQSDPPYWRCMFMYWRVIVSLVVWRSAAISSLFRCEVYLVALSLTFTTPGLHPMVETVNQWLSDLFKIWTNSLGSMSIERVRDLMTSCKPDTLSPYCFRSIFWPASISLSFNHLSASLRICLSPSVRLYSSFQKRRGGCWGTWVSTS